jgi:hypothetical protein
MGKQREDLFLRRSHVGAVKGTRASETPDHVVQHISIDRILVKPLFDSYCIHSSCHQQKRSTLQARLPS